MNYLLGSIAGLLIIFGIGAWGVDEPAEAILLWIVAAVLLFGTRLLRNRGR